jgi:hypothetical protein
MMPPAGRDRLLGILFGPSRDERVKRREAEGRPRTRQNACRLQKLDVGDATQVYEQVCENIRTTDDISFKLLGLVPLISGSGIVVLLSTNTSFSRLPLVLFVGIFGAVVTFGLYRW